MLETLEKIVCKLGFHDWELHLHYKYKDRKKHPDGYTAFPVRECKNCGKLMKHIGFGQYIDWEE